MIRGGIYMWGAIIGDIAGSIYEYDQIKKIAPVSTNSIIPDHGFFSDDTILTIAILKAVLDNQDYASYLKMYANLYRNYKPDFNPYFKTSFSPSFLKWAQSDTIGTSIGNGAMMRISPIGYLFNQEKDIIKNAKLATIPSHNSKEAIECATKVAMVIYLARCGFSKEQIIAKLNLQLDFQPFQKFNATCDATIHNCFYALFTSHNFEEAIRTVLSYGGDTDTNACIVGSMAEAMFGIEEKWIHKCREKLPKEFVETLDTGYSKIKQL